MTGPADFRLQLPARSDKQPSLLDSVEQENRSPNNPAQPVTPFAAAAIVRQEANLLRFPFFALGRKGLRDRKGPILTQSP